MRIKDHDTFEISTFAFSFQPSQRIHSTIHSFAALVEFLLLLLLLLLKKILRNDSHFGCFPIFSSSYSPFIRICFFLGLLTTMQLEQQQQQPQKQVGVQLMGRRLDFRCLLCCVSVLQLI
ncbi:hypothetical protein OUZ56_004655 [Daphnia magna]|uniref:Uncharacterized protein n=1 Tax=Daphnia magna TaxID=35525 RepID=A0ABQ9YQS8_9CRUS|nr:hypothetical protein OUZ56_004655 [Daphnia magna]